MADDVMDMLKRRGRGLQVRQAAESAAVAAVAGCLAAAALAAAWAIQARYVAIAAVVAAVPLALGVGLALLADLRRWLNLKAAMTARVAAILIGAGAFGVAAVTAGFAGRLDRVAVTSILIVAAVLAGAVPVLLRGLDIPRAARLLDNRGRFAERLATAAQLAAAGRTDPVADLVCRQAARILRSGQADRVSLWSRTGATPAALVVAGLLWAMVMLLPTISVAGPADVGRQLAALTPEQKEQLIRQLLKAAASGQTRAAVPVAAKLPEAVNAADAQAFARILDELRAAGVDIDKALAGQFTPLAAASAAATAGKSPTGAKPSHDSVGQPRLPDLAGGPPVWVPPPTLRTAVTTTAPAALDSSQAIPFDRDWRNAQDSAASALDTQSIPLRHRQLVRDFFAEK